MSESARRFRIGYALTPKKVESFMKPSLVDLTKERGIDLVPIDVAIPLTEQGPFDCIVHKLYAEDWKKQLDDFCLKNPNLVIIIDPPDAIERLHDRVSMLEAVTELKITQLSETCGVPKQVVIHDSSLLSDSTAVKEFGFPVIAKPLVVDGSSKSHKMSLVLNSDGLKRLEPPIVLQEFVNHGGVIFKVYVAGEHVKCVKRRSLPDISENLGISSGSGGGLLSFSQISNLALMDGDGGRGIEEAKMPPVSFVAEIATGLRQALGLNLFNFDMIRDRDGRHGNGYLLIDINYFPGYEKLPSYETILTDFFWDILHKEEQN